MFGFGEEVRFQINPNESADPPLFNVFVWDDENSEVDAKVLRYVENSRSAIPVISCVFGFHQFGPAAKCSCHSG